MSNKDSRSIDQQIALLKARGMKFCDQSKAAFYFNHISYYRLKGYWWDMQSDEKKHKFSSDACFENVIERYNFDRQLRLILFDAIEIIEIALRTKMVYHLSQAYGGLWYLNDSIVEKQNIQEHLISGLKNDFCRSNEIFAKNFRAKHNIKKNNCNSNEDPDAWIIFEVATFGTLSKIFKNLKHQLPEKSKITNEMGLNFQNDLSSWLEAITYLRNIIAHHSRIWSRSMTKRPTIIKKPKMQWLQNEITELQIKKPYYIISTMLYLCNSIDPHNNIKQKILDLFQKNPNIPIYKIGFFNNWDQEPMWK